MKFKIIALSFLLVVIFLSCKKEEMSVIGNSEVMFLSNVLVDDQPYYQYVFNDSSLISEVSSKLDYTIYHYNDKNQLVSSDYFWNNTILKNDVKLIETALSQCALISSVNSSKGGTIKYEYTDNQLTKVTYTRPTSGSTEYSVFTYNENNRIDRQFLYWNETETGRIDYFYDLRGNLSKEMLYDMPETGAPELNTTIKYTYDNKQNPYRTLKSLMIPGINTNRNNVIKEIYTVHLNSEQEAEKTEITENTYEYNINGYPVLKNGNVEFVYE